ncbi:OmpH family outer membrane protein [Crocinitomicaceae bacterium]|nr:OmpH family outer membrane protein [Crocinitomicaceae bacterium]
MKKILIALVVLVGFAGTAMSQTKVGHVKSQVLWDTLTMSKTAETQMVDFQKALALELQDLEADLGKLYEDYQKIQNSPSTSQVLLQLKEKAIREKEAEYQNRQQSAQYEVQAYRAELETPITEIIREAVQMVAKRDKYDYVMDVNSGLYVNPDSDITNIVMTELLKLEKEEMAKATTKDEGTGDGGAQ